MNDEAWALLSEKAAYRLTVADVQIEMSIIKEFRAKALHYWPRRAARAEEALAHVIVNADHAPALFAKKRQTLGSDQAARLTSNREVFSKPRGWLCCSHPASTIDLGDRCLTFISLTRLRIRSIRFLPLFAVQTFRAIQQIKKTSGFQTGALLPDRNCWTMTAWDNQESMRQYMNSGPHKKAMPHLMNWCDEASVAHWIQEGSSLPTWEEANRRMRDSGRASKVRTPSPQHAGLTYREPRTSRAVSIRRA